ncbi:unnamed protein product [Moneuplotes crassus]|uniref:Uncharacterized protein n=1 Tax=Euplotes crassus TaxID=5936 RepID=A0AAD1U636_EUPCR|nr:unnamed protein product [Moneuplotes crassus]
MSTQNIRIPLLNLEASDVDSQARLCLSEKDVQKHTRNYFKAETTTASSCGQDLNTIREEESKFENESDLTDLDLVLIPQEKDSQDHSVERSIKSLQCTVKPLTHNLIRKPNKRRFSDKQALSSQMAVAWKRAVAGNPRSCKN